MEAFWAVVQALEGKFDKLELQHVERSDNIATDNLAWVGLSKEPVRNDTFLEILHQPSVTPPPLATSEVAIAVPPIMDTTTTCLPDQRRAPSRQNRCVMHCLVLQGLHDHQGRVVQTQTGGRFLVMHVRIRGESSLKK